MSQEADARAEAGEQAPAGVAEAEGNVQALIDQATEALAAGRVGAALRLARRATEIAADLPATWALLGTVAEEAGDFREALKAYEQALALDPNRPGLRERVEELSRQVPAEEPAAPEQVQPSALDRYAPAFLAASVALLVLAIGLAVVVRSRRAASVKQQYARVMQLGKEYMARQEYDQAEAAFSDALRLKPDSAEAQQWLQRAQQGREMLARLRQWNYVTAGGKFPGQQGTLPPAQITPTRERRQQEQQAQAAARATRRRSSWTPRRYEWRTPSTASNYPSPRQEFGPPEYAPTTPAGSWGPVPPAAGQPPVPLGAGPAGTQAPTAQAPTGAGGQPSEATASQPEASEPSKPKGYLRIVVGEPRPKAEAAPANRGPSADAVRAQADQLRRAGRKQEAKRLYQRAIELYRKEAEADPTARAVKEAGIESCRRAIEQCE